MSKILEMYKAMRQVCRMRPLETTGSSREGRSSDKEAESEFPATTRDPCIVQPLSCD